MEKETGERLEVADKESIDAELQVGALKRRLALLEEESARNKAKLQENIEKCNDTEAACQKNEEGRRAGKLNLEWGREKFHISAPLSYSINMYTVRFVRLSWERHSFEFLFELPVEFISG